MPVAAISSRAENFGEHSGLYYASPRAEGSFLLTASQFDFRGMMIHAVTKNLYAVIVWWHVRTGDHEALIAQQKATMGASDDGTEWRNVTPPGFS